MNFKLFSVSAVALSLMLLFSFSGLKAQNKKLANTLLWEISGKGMKKPSYLYGTMHVSKKIAFHLQDSFFIAITNVDQIAMEMNPENWLQEMMNSNFWSIIQKNISISDLFSIDIYSKLVDFKTPNFSTYKQAFIDNNQVINQLLYRIADNPLTNNYEEETYIDLYIYQTGKKLNKGINGLETFDQSMSMMMKAMMPDKSDKNSAYDNNISIPDIQNKLEKAYRRGDLNELDSLSKLTNTSENYQKYLIDERNKIMVHGMDSLMKLGALFTGVGAAHLPGEKGILNLLLQMGYSVRPVIGTESKTGRKLREKIEDKRYQHQVNTYYLSDSSIQYYLPAPLTAITANFGSTSFSNYLYTDMANGSYYAINRIPHYAFLINKNTSYIISQVDSILYEAIPGKIIKKESITQNEYKGFALKSRLPNGFEIEFKIVFTPLEVIVMKAGGSEKDANSEVWNKFFNSVVFKNLNRQWKKITPENFEFNLEVPSLLSVNNSKKPDNKDIQIQAFDNSDSSFYLVRSSYLDDYEYIEDDTFEFNFISEKLLSRLNATTINREIVPNSFGKAIELTLNTNGPKMKARIIFDQNRYYLLSAIGKNNSFWPHFFNSFNKNKPKLTTHELVDSSLMFKTLTDNEQDKNNESSVFEEMMKNEEIYGETYKNLLSEKKQTYSSRNFPTKIQVSVNSLDKYAIYENADSIWKREKLYLTAILKFNQGGNYISEKSFKPKNEKKFPGTENEYISICDTFSRNSIVQKKVVLNEKIYTLSTVIDTFEGMNQWQTLFYENFEPWDTSKVHIPNNKKDSAFWNDLSKGDSAQFSEAIQSYSASKLFKIHPELVDSIFGLFQTEIFKNRPNEEHVSVIELLNNYKFKNDVYYKKLEDLYKQNSENPEMQFAVLGVLAHQKNLRAYENIKKCFNDGAPLSTENENLSQFFNLVSDSLKLCEMLFPDFLNLLQFQEYKKPVLKLLADIVARNKVKPNTWAASKNNLLREAQIELRRYNSENSNKKKNDEVHYGNADNNDPENITSTLPWDDALGPNKLACYTVIFSSIYNTDEQARQFVDKVLQTKHKGLVYSYAITSYHAKQKVNDSIWNWLAAGNNSRMHFCDWLEVTKDTSLYPKKYYNQKDMCISWLMAVVNDIIEDSIKLVDIRHVANVSGSGKLYFYQYKVKNNANWYMNYVGFQPDDTTKMVSDFSYYSYDGNSIKDLDETKIKEYIGKSCNTVRLKGRKRIANLSNLYPYNMNYEDYGSEEAGY